VNTTESISPSQIFLEAFRRHSAGLCVVTALKADGSPTGFTATSVASLSASPPLASFNMSQTASSWSALKKDARVALHFLGTESLELAQIMAGEASERFVGDHWSPGPHGLPILKGVSAWVEAQVVERVEVEFAGMVAVRITGGGLGPDQSPLAYHQKGYSTTTSL
jgi:flavin reductase (DIM6/NTAB) family NADH-FMN oxidoreductase RutF